MVLYASPFDIALAKAFGIFDQSLHPSPSRYVLCKGPSEIRERTALQPRYAVRSHHGGSLLEVELPGVSKESVDLKVKDQTLLVSGDRKSSRERSLPGKANGSSPKIFSEGREDGSKNADADTETHRAEKESVVGPRNTKGSIAAGGEVPGQVYTSSYSRRL